MVYALDVVGRDGAQVRAASGGGLVAHAVGAGARGFAGARGGDGLQVGVVAYRGAVEHDGRAEGVIVITVDLADVGLCQIVERRIDRQGSWHELQHVRQALGLDVAHGVLIDDRLGAHGLLARRHGDSAEAQVEVGEAYVQAVAPVALDSDLAARLLVAEARGVVVQFARRHARDLEVALLVAQCVERAVEHHVGHLYGMTLVVGHCAAQRDAALNLGQRCGGAHDEKESCQHSPASHYGGNYGPDVAKSV